MVFSSKIKTKKFPKKYCKMKNKLYYLVYFILIKLPDFMLLKPYFRSILRMRVFFLNKLPNMDIQKNVKILNNTIITRRSNLILEDNVIIKRNCYLDGNIEILKNTIVLSNTRIDGVGKVKIGKNSHIGRDNNIFSHYHKVDKKEILVNDSEEIPQNTIIGDNVMLYSNVAIMGGVTIEDGAVIGFGSIVTKDVLKNSICVGVPAKCIGHRE